MFEANKRGSMRGLMSELTRHGLTEYGAFIPKDLVHEILEIEIPDIGTKNEFDQLALYELAAIDYCRNILLGQGKYLLGTNSGYRILLPSENKKQVDSYISSADKKLSRALKLSRNSPVESGTNDQTEARIMMKRNDSRRPYDKQLI